jgi:hypothetical protein
MTLAGFGGVAGFFALFFFSDIPRVKKDIVQKIPIIGPHYIKEVPASDNVGGKSHPTIKSGRENGKRTRGRGKLASTSAPLPCSRIETHVRAGRILWSSMLC